MNNLIVIRDLRANDELATREVYRNALLSQVMDSFISILLKEITFQLIVFTAAIMFIFVGYPMSYCILSIPIVIILIYVSLYSSYVMTSIEIFQTKHLQCWVAEACEPYFFAQEPQTVTYKIVTEQDLKDESEDIGNMQRKIIGTVAVMKHKVVDNGCWIYRLGVDKRYRGKGVGTALAKAAIKWTKIRSYDKLECAVTENQNDARKVFINIGFQMRQMYHKKYMLNAFKVAKFQLGLDLNPLL